MLWSEGRSGRERARRWARACVVGGVALLGVACLQRRALAGDGFRKGPADGFVSGDTAEPDRASGDKASGASGVGAEASGSTAASSPYATEAPASAPSTTAAAASHGSKNILNDDEDDRVRPALDIRASISLWGQFGESRLDQRSSPGSQFNFNTRYHDFFTPVADVQAEVVFFRLLGVEFDGGLSIADGHGDLDLDTVERAPSQGTTSEFDLKSAGSLQYYALSFVHRAVAPNRTGPRGWTLDLCFGWAEFANKWRDSSAHDELTSNLTATGKVRESRWHWQVARLGARLTYESRYWGLEGDAAIFPYGEFVSHDDYVQGGTNYGSAGTHFRVRSYGFSGGELKTALLIMPLEFLRIDLGYRLTALYSEGGRGRGHDATGNELQTHGREAESFRHGPFVAVTLVF